MGLLGVQVIVLPAPRARPRAPSRGGGKGGAGHARAIGKHGHRAVSAAVATALGRHERARLAPGLARSPSALSLSSASSGSSTSSASSASSAASHDSTKSTVARVRPAVRVPAIRPPPPPQAPPALLVAPVQ